MGSEAQVDWYAAVADLNGERHTLQILALLADGVVERREIHQRQAGALGGEAARDGVRMTAGCASDDYGLIADGYLQYLLIVSSAGRRLSRPLLWPI